MTQPHAGDGPEPAEDATENAPENVPGDVTVDAAAEERAGRRAAVTTFLRERRLLVLAVAAVAVVAVAATLVVTLSGGADRPVPGGSIPVLSSQFAAPRADTPSRPAGPEDLPVYTGQALWTAPLPPGTEDHDLSGLALTDAGYVLEQRDAVIGLDKAGKEIWRFTPPAVDYFTLRVTGPRVFVGYDNPDDDRWPQPQVVIALDPATGAELWRETEASLWSVTTDTIYLSVCHGGQNNRVGDCRLSARDPADNTTRWQVPAYASARVERLPEGPQAGSTPPYLLVGAYASGADTYVLSAMDPATGATLGRGYDDGDDRVGSIDALTERTIVTGDGGDDNPADGCTTLLTGFSVRGAGQRWQYTARTSKKDDGRYCASLPGSTNDGRMAVTAGNGAPSVLNVDTGAVEWSAPVGGDAIAASATTLLVVEPLDESAPDRAAELVAYRVGDAEPVWRAPFTGSTESSTVIVTGTTAVVLGGGYDTVGYDLKTGEAWTYGTTARLGDGWFAACSATACRGYAIT